jgi:hypothetical protein
MATRITFNGTTGNEQRSVQETAQEVADQINAGSDNPRYTAIFTDAASEKGFSIRVGSIIEVEEE